MTWPNRSLTLVTALSVLVSACDASRNLSPLAADASASVSTAGGPRWTVVDLGPPPALLQFGYFPHAVSNAGHVTGQGRINGFTHGVSVTPTGRYTVMRPLPGDVGTFPGQINAQGITAGISVADQQYSSRVAVTWDRAGRPTPIPGLPRSDGEDASLINDAGMVVGYTKKFNSYGSGFIWQSGWPDARELETPTPGFSPNFLAMNTHGVVVGSTQDVTYAIVGVMWDVMGKATVLPNPPGAIESRATAINDAGVVSGAAVQPDGTTIGWTWTPSGGYRMLLPPAGYANLIVSAIDNQGRVYGLALNAVGPRVVVVITDGRTIAVPTINGASPGTIVSASGIILGNLPVGSVGNPAIFLPRR